MTAIAYTGARVFDGNSLRDGHALVVDGARVAAITPENALSPDIARQELPGGILAPGFIDLQVNGGGGVMFNAVPTIETLATIAATHARLGATTILPTLITDTPEVTRAAIAAVVEAFQQNFPGIAGLHLEGPHLCRARKGAHAGTLIRPMAAADEDMLIAAADRLTVLKVTLAPEAVTPEQIGRLTDAGIIVSLGHSDCTVEGAEAAQIAGATCVTHLFNAMSQMTARAPGLVGAALSNGAFSAGLIADGIHVHPANMRAALAAKAKPGGIFLVSDAMAPAGSDITRFELNGREIQRANGRLTLADGTLAGADLDLATAIRNVHALGVDLAEALTMATSRPAQVAGLSGGHGRLAPEGPADFVHLTDDLHLSAVWQSGARLG